MKNLFFTIAFGIVAFTASASNLEIKLISLENTSDLIEIQDQIELDQISIENVELFTEYTGVCLDGHRFSFKADSREEGQAYVNGYCRARTEAKKNTLEPVSGGSWPQIL